MTANTAKKVSYIFLGLSFFAILVTMLQLIGNAYGILLNGYFYETGRYFSVYLAYVPFLLLVGVVVILANTIISKDAHLERLALYLFIALLLHKAVVLYVSSYMLTYIEVTQGYAAFSDLVMITSRRLQMTDILSFRIDMFDIRSYMFSISSLEFLPIISIAVGKSLSKNYKNGYIIATIASLFISFFMIATLTLFVGYSSGIFWASPFILEFALIAYAFYYTYVKDNRVVEEIKVKGEAYE